MEAAKFAEAAVGEESFGGTGEFDKAEGGPEVFAEAGGDGFFAEERELFEGVIILGRCELV